MANKPIAIIGGGITGLAAAWHLEQKGFKDITLLEHSNHPGGKIKTEQEDDFIIETGPDALMYTKPGIQEFIKELGLEDQLVAPKSRHFYILHQGELKPVPAGFGSMVPADLTSFLKSDLISWKGKARMLVERFIKPKTDQEEESLAHFVERRFGKEVLDQMAEPLFSGVYSAPANQLSIDATFPHFKQMEAKYGSITKAVMASRKQYGLPKNAPFRSFKNGMQTLPKTLEKQLKVTKLLKNTAVKKIESEGDHYQLTTNHHSTIQIQEILLTIPSQQAAEMLKNLAPSVQPPLQDIHFATSVIVTLAYERSQIDHSLDATGFLIPGSENTQLSACTWSSEKWPGRAPQGYATFRCFFSNIGNQELEAYDEQSWTRLADEELKKILSINAEPSKSWHHVWKDAQPQYKMGHLHTIQQIENHLRSLPGLHLAGSSYRGVGIPDCVKQAREMVDAIEHD